MLGEKSNYLYYYICCERKNCCCKVLIEAAEFTPDCWMQVSAFLFLPLTPFLRLVMLLPERSCGTPNTPCSSNPPNLSEQWFLFPWVPFVLVTKSCSFFKDVGFQDMLRGSAASSLLGVRQSCRVSPALQVPTLDSLGAGERDSSSVEGLGGDPMPLEGQRAQTDLPPQLDRPWEDWKRAQQSVL